MAKKPRAAKSNTLGLKNKAKTAARRAAKVKARPQSKAKGKTKPAAKGKTAAEHKKAGLSQKKFAKPAKAEKPVKQAPAAAPTKADDQEMANRLLFSLAKETTPAVPAVAATNPTNPTENFFHSKAKALRDANKHFTQHAHDSKRGGFNARLPGAQKGRRGK